MWMLIVTHSTYLSNADQVHPFLETVVPDGSYLFQQDNALCHTVKMVQEWLPNQSQHWVQCPPLVQQKLPNSEIERA